MQRKCRFLFIIFNKPITIFFIGLFQSFMHNNSNWKIFNYNNIQGDNI